MNVVLNESGVPVRGSTEASERQQTKHETVESKNAFPSNLRLPPVATRHSSR